MKTIRLTKCISFLLASFLLTGCASSATTVHVDVTEGAAASQGNSLLVPAAQESIQDNQASQAARSSLESTLETPVILSLQEEDIQVVSITPAPVPAEGLETMEPVQTPAPAASPSPTPVPTETPEPTPAYTVEELDEYVDAYVNAATINLRAGPGTDYDILAEYERYDELLVTGTCEEWYRVKLDGLRGYMLMEFVTIGEVPEPTPAYTVEELDEYVDGYVSAATVNLRAGPGTDYDILAEYARYDELLVTGTSEEWYRVKLDGLRGYMLMDYVTIGTYSTPEPTETPAPTEAPESTPEPVSTPAPTTSISEADDLYLVAQVVYREGDMDSYVAVANVIYNRLQSSSFPDTIQEVIYQKNQFSTSNLKAPSSSAMAAVQQIFIDGALILPSDVMYFWVASKGTDRSGYTYYATYGNNVFFSR